MKILSDKFLTTLNNSLTNNTFDELVLELKSSQMKTINDYLFRQVMLMRAFENGGYYTCPLSKAGYLNEDNVHVCHYIDREYLHLRWDFRNCVLCWSRSNTVDSNIPHAAARSKHHFDYEQYLGEENKGWLVEQYNKKVQFSKYDYKEKLKELLNERYRKEDYCEAFR